MSIALHAAIAAPFRRLRNRGQGMWQQRTALLFGACCWLVAAISVHDALLLVLNEQVIAEFEQNPIGKWLIDLQGGDVWLFVLLKLVGTSLACSVLKTLYEHRSDLALAAAGALACFQGALLAYLSLA